MPVITRRGRATLGRTPLCRATRGQTLVEYLLLIAVIVGGVAIFRSVALPKIQGILNTQTQTLQTTAWRGGDASLTSPYVGAPVVGVK